MLMCQHSHIYKLCQLLRQGISVLEVAVFEIVGKNFYPASQVVWSLHKQWILAVASGKVNHVASLVQAGLAHHVGI